MVPDLRFGTLGCGGSEREEIADALRSVLPAAPELVDCNTADAISDFMRPEKGVRPFLFCSPKTLAEDQPPLRLKNGPPIPIIVWPTMADQADVPDAFINTPVRNEHITEDLKCAIGHHVGLWAHDTISLILRQRDTIPLAWDDTCDRASDYIAFLRKALGATAIGHYSLGGRERTLHLRRSSGTPLEHHLSYRVVRSILEFREEPRIATLSEHAARELFVPDAAPPFAFFVSYFLCKDSVPTLIVFQFQTPVDLAVLRDVCVIAAQELWHVTQHVDHRRRTECLRALARTQRYLPDQKEVALAICEELTKYFCADGASLLILSDTRGQKYSFEKIYIHHGRKEETSFWTDHGYAYDCVQHGKALLITETDDNKKVGMGLRYDLSDLRVGRGQATRIRYTLAPRTIDNEASLLLLPVNDLQSDGRVRCVLKIGEFGRSNAFNISDLRALQIFGEQTSALLCAIRLGANLDAAHETLRRRTDVQDEAEDLFVYRDLALETFHQIASCLDNINVKVLSAQSHCDGPRQTADDLRNILASGLASVRDGKHLLKIATDRGRSLQPITKDCWLVEDVLRPAIKRANRRIPGKWSITHTVTQHDFRVHLDPVLMRESFVNVLNNAIWAVNARLHRDDSKLVFVVVRQIPQQNRVKIVVRDNGIGIEPEHQKRIFQQFFTTRGKKGTGLGLFLSRRIVSHFGGTLKMARSYANTGTSMVFDLPILKE